ncbi:hypothetical protein BWI93_24375 [Siphonobacter sp. BAB-5385]|uniref:ferritin-like domain-containing protein n=1 Tax=unclassified Siphonobacter TaxID=2635712 RepID=UPI000B9EC9BF|nr:MULTISPECIES: ferritin-like domain-containing protein [unclassified Siphonobacter]OZI05579.1 hypothetical protein BWI93_24375 [Siphonobacter sp. BAB-5385]PMD95911.1 hypothetical protein BWI97_13675 [Siphonobacter sp. BAB-5405]
MNLFDIFSNIEKVDAEAADRFSFYNRRHVLKFGAKATALAALPTFFSSVVNKAYAALPNATEVLKYALTLEYLEDAFYKKGLATSGLIPSMDRAIFAQISKHEDAHVKLLQGALAQLNVTVAMPTFDFGPAFDNYQNFLVYSQSFEDLGVRAYKGQAGVLKQTDYLTVALQIHSVEARHAAMVRALRGDKGWIQGNSSGNAVKEVYAGEEVVKQAGVYIGGLPGQTDNSASEAFDEPLDEKAVLALAGLFIK